MKRCPQCEFVYEDDQSLCDMDGSELMHDALSLPLPALEEITGKPVAGVVTPPARSPWRSIAEPAILGILLAALLFASYYAATGGWSRRYANRSMMSEAAAQPLPQLIPEPSPALEENPPVAETSPLDANPSALQTKAAGGTPLSSGPVRAAGSTQRGRGPVVIRLTNGATIKADEAWEKREGIWYRQAGVLTLVKRKQTQAIERGAPPPAPAPEEKKPQPKVEPKKESRVSSFLKTTGRILKRPFKF